MSYLLINDKKWIDKYNKKVKSYLESDILILNYDISENHKIFTDIWTVQFTLINAISKSYEIYKININFDGTISCNCKNYIHRCKDNLLPCTHLLHIVDCIFDKNTNEIELFFKKQYKLNSFDIEYIKNKIQNDNYCLMCCEQISGKNHLDKHMFTTIKTKFNCNRKCHNHCLNKLYECVNK